MAHYDHDYSAPDNKMSPEERLIQWLKIVFALKEVVTLCGGPCQS
jgi:hypothetical protein